MTLRLVTDEGPSCPKCGSAMWDNRAEKAAGIGNPKRPDFKCKNRTCGHAIWPEPLRSVVVAEAPPAREPRACPGCGEDPAWHNTLVPKGKDGPREVTIQRYLYRHKEQMACGRFNGAHVFADPTPDAHPAEAFMAELEDAVDAARDPLADGIGLG